MMDEVYRVYLDVSKELKKKFRKYFFLYLLISFLKSIVLGFTAVLFLEFILIFFRTELTFFTMVLVFLLSGISFLILSLHNVREKISLLAETGEEFRNALEISSSPSERDSRELRILFFGRVLSMASSSLQYAKKLLLRSFLPFLPFFVLTLLLHSFSSGMVKKRFIYSPGIFLDSRVKITPPSYSGLRKYEVNASKGRFELLKGSEVEIEALLKRMGGTHSFRLCENEVPFERKGEKFRLRFEMKEECALEVRIEDRFSIKHFSPFYFALKKDEYPEVELKFPPEDVVMKKGERDLAVKFEARDDFGISRISLVYHIFGREFRMDYPLEVTAPKELEGSLILPASSFPGDVDVYYYIEARDNDAVSGPKVGISKRMKVHITGETSFHEEVVRKIRTLYESTVMILSVSIGFFKGRVPSEELVKKLEDVIKSSEEIKKMAEKDRGLSHSLSSFITSLPSAFKRVRSYVLSGNRERTLSEVEDIVYSFTEELRLQTVSDAYAAGERIKKLVEMAKEALKEGKKELAEILTMKIEEEMRKLKELISSLPREILTEFINPDALPEVDLAKKENLERGFDEYLKSLEDLLKGLESAGRNLAMGGNPELFKTLMEARERLSSLIERETALKGKTEGIISQCEGGRIEKEFDALMKYMDEMMGNPSIREEWKNLYRDPEALKEKLKEGKMAWMAGNVRESKKMLKEFERTLRSAGAYSGKKEFSELARRVEELILKMEKGEGIYEEVSREEAERMAQEQWGIKEDTRRLSSKMGDFLPSLRDAERFMEEAEGTLRGRLMRDALNAEENAINSLKEAERKVSERISLIEEGWKGFARMMESMEGMVGPEVSGERVEIPKEAERYLQELRREVMKILEKGLPRRHQEENRGYYEEIIK